MTERGALSLSVDGHLSSSHHARSGTVSFFAARRNNSRNPQKPALSKMSMKRSDTIGILAFLFCLILLLSAGWMVWEIVEYATSELEIPRLTPGVHRSFWTSPPPSLPPRQGGHRPNWTAALACVLIKHCSLEPNHSSPVQSPQLNFHLDQDT